MKKIPLIFQIVLLVLLNISSYGVHFLYAEGGINDVSPSETTTESAAPKSSTSDSKGSILGKPIDITTYTSEPGLFSSTGKGENCEETSKSSDPQMQVYKCTISAENGFQTMITNIYKYIFFISIIIAVLILVAIGILMSISGIFPEGEEMKNKAKEKLVQMLIGVLALALIPWILKTVAPFIFK